MAPAAATEISEFVRILKLISQIVQWCVEASLDLVLLVLLLLPLLLPWRIPAICHWACNARAGTRTRGHLRGDAVMHILVALFDLLVAPLTLVALLIPTRTVTIIQALWYSNKEDDDGVWDEGAYNVGLRVFLLRSFVEGVLDLIVFPFLIVAFVQVGRIRQIISVSYAILFPSGSEGILSSPSPLTPAVCKSRWIWIQRLASMRTWWLESFADSMIDLPCLILGFLSLVCPTRLFPFFKGLSTLCQETESLKWDKVQGIAVFPWEILRRLCLQSFGYAILDLLALPFFIVAALSGVRTLPFLIDLRRDRFGSPTSVLVRFLNSDNLDALSEPRCSNLEGQYRLCGVFRGSPLYEQECVGGALMGFWNDAWHIFYKGTEDEPALTIMPSSDPQTGVMKKACKSSPCHKGVCSGGSEMPGDIGVTVTCSEEALSFPLGRDQSYNTLLRRHAFRHGCYALLDIAFLPFFLLVLLTGYRFPAVLQGMNADGVAEGKSKGLRASALDTAGKSSNLSFGWNARGEVLRQSCLLVCDLLILPFLLLCISSIYRIQALRGKFSYKALSFHRHVLLNASIVTCDLAFSPPALLLFVTGYRLRFVREAQKKHGHEGPWRWRCELLRQAALLLVDILIALPCLLVFATRYQWRNCAEAFAPTTLEFHAEVLLSAVVVLHDFLLLITFGLLLALSCYRIPFIRDAARAEPDDHKDMTEETRAAHQQCRIRVEVYRQGGLLLCDLFVALPLLLVLVSRYRAPRLKGTFSPTNLSFHAAVLKNGVVAFHDIFLMAPLALLLALSYYRLRFVRRILASPPPAPPDKDHENQSQFSCEVKSGSETLFKPETSDRDVEERPVRFFTGAEPTAGGPPPAVVSLGTNPGAPVWQVQMKIGTWVDFEGDALGAIVRAQQFGAPSAKYSIHRQEYEIVFGQGVQRNVTTGKERPVRKKPDGDEKQWRARGEVYVQFGLLLCDILMAPMLLVVLAGWKHRQPELSKAFEDYLEFHITVLIESVVLVHDLLLFLIFGLGLMLTLYRLPHVMRARAEHRATHLERKFATFQEARDFRQNFMRLLIYQQAGLLFCDLLVAIPLLLVLISGYRARHLSGLFAQDDLRFHKAALWNACIVLHDGLLLLPAAIILLITCYRSQPVCALLRRRPAPAAATEVKPKDDLEAGNQTQTNLQVDHELIAADSRWAEYVDWTRAPMQPEESQEPPPSRGRCWKEFCNFLIDLPFIIVGLVVLLCIWRGPMLIGKLKNCRNANMGRCETVRQLVFTFRDLLCLPLLVLVICSPYCVGFFAGLFSRLNVPLKCDSILQVDKVQISVPEKGKTVLSVEARLQKPLLAVAANSVKVQVLGPGFWQSVERVFGSTAAGVAQGFLPLKLKVRDTDIYDAVYETSKSTAQALTFSVTVPVSSKRDTAEKNLKKLAQDSSMLIQVEARAVTGKQMVLFSVPLKLAGLTAIVASGAGELTGDSLVDEDLVRQCKGGKHQGLVDSFWMLCSISAVQAFLDYVHCLLALFTLVTPWRFIGLVVCLCEPKIRWPMRLTDKALGMLQLLKFNLHELRGELVALCNSTAKDTSAARDWSKYGTAPKALQKFSSKRLSEHNFLTKSLRQMHKSLPEPVAEGIQRWLEMQDACVYHVALRCYINCMLSARQLKIEEHGLLLGRVQSAEVSLQSAAERVYAGVLHEVETIKQDVHAQGCRKAGCCRKDAKLMRRMVRAFVMATITDIVGFILVALLLCTVYRIPMLVRDLVRNRTCSPTSMTFKVLVIRHLRALASDILLASQIVLLSLLVMVTLVRVPYALNEAAAAHHSLESLRDMLLNELGQVCEALWELLSLFTMLKTYKILLRAVLQCFLVPPACLSELVGRLCRCLPLCLRFSVSFVAFYMLGLVPALQNWLDGSVEHHVVQNVFMGGLASFLFCNIASVFSLKDFYALPCKDGDWVPATLRLTWCNIVSLLAVVGQPCLICLTLLSLHGSSAFGAFLCTHAESLHWMSLVLSSAWLLIISLMFVAGQSDDYKLLQASPVFRGVHLLLSQACFLPIVLSALLPALDLGCEQGSQASWLECRSLMVFYVYVLTSQMLSSDAGTLEALPKKCGIDVRYAPLYLMGAQFADVCIITLPVVLRSAETHLIASIAISGASFFWSSAYQCIRASPASCVPHVTALRAGGSLAVTWTSIFCLLSKRQGQNELPQVLLIAGLALCAVLSVLAGAWARWRDRERRRFLLQQSGIYDAIRQLAQTEEQLCVKDAVMGGWGETQRRALWQQTLKEDHTPSSLAQCMLSFETHILAERLSDEFLMKRKDWCSDVGRARSFPDLVRLGKVLQNSLRLPSTLPQLIKSMTQIMKRDDLALKTLDFVVGHEMLRALFEAALVARTSAPPKHRGRIDIALHCIRSQTATQEVMSHFSGSAGVSFSGLTTFSTFKKSDGLLFFTPEGEMCTEVPKWITEMGRQQKSELRKSSSIKGPLEKKRISLCGAQDSWSLGSSEGHLPSFQLSSGSYSPSTTRRNISLSERSPTSPLGSSGTLLSPAGTARKIGKPELSSQVSKFGTSEDVGASRPHLSPPTVLMLPTRTKEAASRQLIEI